VPSYQKRAWKFIPLTVTMVDQAVLPPAPKLAVKFEPKRLGKGLAYHGDQRDPHTEALVDPAQGNGLTEVSAAIQPVGQIRKNRPRRRSDQETWLVMIRMSVYIRRKRGKN